MKSLEERLNGIREAKVRIDKVAERRKEDAVNYKLFFEFEQFRGYAKRIDELLQVANALIANGITLGAPKKVRAYHLFPTPEFESESTDHKLGFLIESSGGKPFAIGFKGGGCDGHDFAINSEGVVIRYNAYEAEKDNRHWRANKFIAEFDKFERKFYEYVDNL